MTEIRNFSGEKGTKKVKSDLVTIGDLLARKDRVRKRHTRISDIYSKHTPKGKNRMSVIPYSIAYMNPETEYIDVVTDDLDAYDKLDNLKFSFKLWPNCKAFSGTNFAHISFGAEHDETEMALGTIDCMFICAKEDTMKVVKLPVIQYNYQYYLIKARSKYNKISSRCNLCVRDRCPIKYYESDSAILPKIKALCTTRNAASTAGGVFNLVRIAPKKAITVIH